MPEYSTNERAEQIVGKREIEQGTIILDSPAELGYRCPKCQNETIADGNYDERLHFSEYESFLWCEMCNQDYPSALCMVDNPELATKIYLDAIESAVKRATVPTTG